LILQFLQFLNLGLLLCLAHWLILLRLGGLSGTGRFRFGRNNPRDVLDDQIMKPAKNRIAECINVQFRLVIELF